MGVLLLGNGAEGHFCASGPAASAWVFSLVASILGRELGKAQLRLPKEKRETHFHGQRLQGSAFVGERDHRALVPCAGLRLAPDQQAGCWLARSPA